MAGNSPTLSRNTAAAMWEHYLGDRSAHGPGMEYVVPGLVDDLTGVAPAHLTVAECDVLRDEALDYARRLGAAGVPVELDVLPGAVHGFDGLLPDTALARSAISRQIAAIASALER